MQDVLTMPVVPMLLITLRGVDRHIPPFLKSDAMETFANQYGAMVCNQIMLVHKVCADDQLGLRSRRARRQYTLTLGPRGHCAGRSRALSYTGIRLQTRTGEQCDPSSQAVGLMASPW